MPYLLFIIFSMLRRLITIIILLTISFFILRWVNPAGAAKLVLKVKNTYYRVLGKAQLTGDISTGDVEVLTGVDMTGALATTGGELLNSGAVPTTGDIATDAVNTGLLSNPLLEETANTGTVTDSNIVTKTSTTTAPTTTTQTPSPTTTTTKTSTTPTQTPTTSSTSNANKGLSSKDIKDTKNLMNSLFK